MLTPVAQFFENIKQSIIIREYKNLTTSNFEVIDPETKEIESLASKYDDKKKHHFVITNDGRQFVGAELEDLAEVIRRYNLHYSGL